MNYASFDSMVWPMPDDDMGEVNWQLRYGDYGRVRFSAASVVSAYFSLIWMDERRRRKVIREIRKQARRP